MPLAHGPGRTVHRGRRTCRRADTIRSTVLQCSEVKLTRSLEVLGVCPDEGVGVDVSYAVGENWERQTSVQVA